MIRRPDEKRGPVVRPRARVRIGRGAMLAAIGLILSGCSQSSSRRTDWSSERRTGVSSSPRVVTWDQPVPRGGGTAKIGPPYQIAGRWYVPREEPNYDQSGTASWYGIDFHGRRTANGEIFDMATLSAAHPTLPLPSYVTVTNVGNGRSVLVRVNDRGPYAHNRLIDLSRRSAEALGFQAQGTANVRVRYAGPASIDGNTAREETFLRQQPWFGSVAVASAAPVRPARWWPGGMRPSGLGGAAADDGDGRGSMFDSTSARAGSDPAPAWLPDPLTGR